MRKPLTLDDAGVPELILELSFSPEEVDFAEQYESLRLDQRPEYCSGFLDLEAIRFLNLTTEAMSGIAKEFKHACYWHTWRATQETDPAAQQKRSELAAKYRAMANNLRAILRENLN